ncbi:hypothetical protein ACQPZ8_18245 [Actinomadura nitritigenes]|uniref:hypothetical protein n=1 Tax=Actinomadura nitritigenes TaxID=134602 RepID=UPI003D919C85
MYVDQFQGWKQPTVTFMPFSARTPTLATIDAKTGVIVGQMTLPGHVTYGKFAQFITTGIINVHSRTGNFLYAERPDHRPTRHLRQVIDP